MQAYLGFEKGAESAQVEWHLDFSCSGLAIHRMEVKARCGWEEERGREAITFTVEGDNKVFCSPELGGKHDQGILEYMCVHVHVHTQFITEVLSCLGELLTQARSAR